MTFVLILALSATFWMIWPPIRSILSRVATIRAISLPPPPVSREKVIVGPTFFRASACHWLI